MIVGLTSGTFDLFHHSHLLYLEHCKDRCDKLIVGVDSDELARQTKGPTRPIHGEMHRFNLLNSLSVIDVAFVLKRVEDLRLIARDFNVDKVFKCQKFANNSAGHVYGTETAELLIIPDIPGMISTTQIVEAIKEGRTAIGPIPVRKQIE